MPYSSRSGNYGLLEPKFSKFICEDIWKKKFWEIDCGGIWILHLQEILLSLCISRVLKFDFCLSLPINILRFWNNNFLRILLWGVSVDITRPKMICFTCCYCLFPEKSCFCCLCYIFNLTWISMFITFGDRTLWIRHATHVINQFTFVEKSLLLSRLSAHSGQELHFCPL